MKKNYFSFPAFLAIVILLSTQLTNAQTKSVIQPNFVNPFGKKQNKGKVQAIKPTGQPQPKSVQQNENFSIQKVDDYSIIQFSEKSQTSAKDFFESFAKSLTITDADKFNLLKSENDEIGFTHYRYQQTYKSISVNGSEYLLHEKNGKLISANGNFYSGLSINVSPSVTKETAIQNAIKFVGAEKYQWENQDEENFLKKEKNNANATYYPQAELVIAPINGIYIKENFRLCYKINIASEKPYDIVDVFIDANTGEAINKIGKIAHADVVGTANTLYSGTKPITMDSYSGSYRLRETGRPIQTFNMKNGTNYASAVDFTNATTTWNTQEVVLNSITISTVNNTWEDFFGEQISSGGAPDLYIEIIDASSNIIWTKANHYFENTFPPITINTGGLLLSNGPYTLNVYDYDVSSSDDLLGSFSFTATGGTATYSASGTSGSISKSARNNSALDAHWGLEKTYDFYLSQLSRNSFDNAGGLIKSYIHYGIGFNNGYWNSSVITLGDGDGSFMSPTSSLDFVGHEFTHAVVQYTAGLVYQGESGALNESFADIFGTAIEFYAGTSPNWTMFESNTLFAPFYSRSLSNPNSGPPSQNWQQPDTYTGTYWVDPTGTLDNGGVHTNSGVQNFWFYLLSQGGSGTNDIGNAFSVTGIGINQATQIAYRNLRLQLTSTSNYMSAYYGSLQAAEDLYGANSTQQNAVRAAWYAVGIGNNPSGQCAGTTTFTAPSGTFADGSGTATYQINLDCMWLIQPTGANTISLNFPTFDTENGYDSVMVYDGPTTSDPLLMTWWGNTLPPTINSTSGALLVRFKSDNTINNPGWIANYTSSGTAYCNGGTLLTSATGSFNDGSGGSNYGNNQLCYWLIAPPCANNVTLSFSSFNTEAGYDGVIVYNGNNTSAPILLNTSGTTIPSSVTSSGGEMLVVFISDYSTRMQGFASSYTSTGTPYCSGTTTINTTDAATITDGSGGSNYCNNMDCRYLIQPPQATTVTFSFTAFDVESMSTDGFSIYDAVEIYDGTSTAAPLLGRFSGNSLPPSVTSTGGSMYIRFFSDISETRAGWTGYFTSTTANYCSGTTTLTAPSGTFADGSGAILYGNGADCKWLIQPSSASSITLTFSSFDTELNYDGVIVYDGNNTSAPQLGTFSGGTIPSAVTSTGGSMLVWFISDGSVRQNGWNASYNSLITGINENSTDNNIVVYPNPNDGTFTIKINGDIEIETISIYNSTGQNVWNNQLPISNTAIPVTIENFSSGLYLIQMKTINGLLNKQIIINK